MVDEHTDETQAELDAVLRLLDKCGSRIESVRRDLAQAGAAASENGIGPTDSWGDILESLDLLERAYMQVSRAAVMMRGVKTPPSE